MLRVLILLNRYLPGYKSGGPVRSIAQIVAQLGGEFDFSVLTTDRDTGDDVPYRDIEKGTWGPNGKAAVRYLSPGETRHLAMARAIRARAHDVLYLNSFLSPRFSIGPMIARHLGMIPRKPVIIAPRGEFSRGALELKATKKAAFLRFARSSGIWRDVTWQASTPAEAEDIRAIMGRQADRVEVACDLTSPITTDPSSFVPRPPGTPPRVVFLSRLTPKKNLLFALEVLAGISVPLDFSIVGPEEDTGYVRQCRQLAARLPGNIRVNWVGAVRHERISEILAAHDLLFLPTRGENFGHVIAEAFSAGLPVLLSDTTPWRGLAERGIGYDLPLGDIGAFRAALGTEAARDAQDLLTRRKAVLDYAKARVGISGDVDANRTLFGSVGTRS